MLLGPKLEGTGFQYPRLKGPLVVVGSHGAVAAEAPYSESDLSDESNQPDESRDLGNLGLPN